MAIMIEPGQTALLVDREELLRIVDQQYAVLGIPPDRSATAEQSRALILADGVRPEDNVFSRGIIEAREE